MVKFLVVFIIASSGWAVNEIIKQSGSDTIHAIPQTTPENEQNLEKPVNPLSNVLMALNH